MSLCYILKVIHEDGVDEGSAGISPDFIHLISYFRQMAVSSGRGMFSFSQISVNLLSDQEER
jgi:hypothetical protein